MKLYNRLLAVGFFFGLLGCSSSDDNGIVEKKACEKESYFVANYVDGTVSAVDLCNNTVSKNIIVGTAPSIWAYDETNGRIYVSNQSGTTVSVINVNTAATVATLNVGNAPRDISIDETRGIVYVTNRDDDTVSVFATTDHVTFTEDVNSPIAVGSGPHDVVVNSASGKAYVAMDKNDVYVIDGTGLSVAPTILDLTPNVVGAPTVNRMLLNEINNKIYVTRTHSDVDKDRVAIIDTTDDSVLVTAVAEGANRMAIDLAGNVYVASGAADQVTKISVTDETDKTVLTAGDNPDGIVATEDGTKVFVSNRGANNDGNTVSAIEVASNTKTDIVVGTNPVNLAYSASLNRLYVSNRGTNNDGNTVSVIDTLTNTVVSTITVGVDPRGSRVVSIGD